MVVKKILYIRKGASIESIANLWKGSVIEEDNDRLLVRIDDYRHKQLSGFSYSLWIFKDYVGVLG